MNQQYFTKWDYYRFFIPDDFPLALKYSINSQQYEHIFSRANFISPDFDLSKVIKFFIYDLENFFDIWPTLDKHTKVNIIKILHDSFLLYSDQFCDIRKIIESCEWYDKIINYKKKN